MALTSGPNLALLVNGAAGEEHYTELMRFLRGLDALVQPRVVDKDLSAPPGSPADGAVYIVGASPSGAWSGHVNDLARYSTVLAAWEFITPKSGWTTWVIDESKQYRFASAWAEVISGGGSSTPSPRVETASTTLVMGDVDNGVHMNVASANTITVPPNSSVAFALNVSIPLLVKGAGLATVVEGAGVTVRVPAPLTLGLRAQWSQAVLTKIGTNEWVLAGDLA